MQIKIPELMPEQVQLQEMDWQRAKDEAKEQIRNARLMLELNSVMLVEAEKQLRLIWAKLSDDERTKRLEHD